MRILLLKAGERKLGVRLEAVQEVLPVAELVRPPEAPDVLEGFLLLRGAPVPVLRIDRLLGFEMQWDVYSPLIVVKGTPRPVAWLASRAAGIVEVAAEHLAPLAPGDSLNGVATASVPVEGGAAVLLDPARLLLETERRQIEALERRAAERAGLWRGALAN